MMIGGLIITFNYLFRKKITKILNKNIKLKYNNIIIKLKYYYNLEKR